MIDEIVLLAQQSQPQPQNQPTGGGQFFIFAVLMAVLAFMFLSARSQKKREQRAREEMFSRMGKNDRVQTIGGIIGTVVAVKDNEVVLKVDESTNTKMTFVRSAIQRVLSDDQAIKK